MKNIIKLTFAAVSLFTLSACSEGYIDDISQVAQGEDKIVPIITINSPTAGTTTIPFTDTTTDFKFDYKVTDDIEISNIEILVDGAVQKSYNSFLDYRGFSEIYTKNLGLGSHTFTVNAKDFSGKTSTKSVSFVVDNKYTALYGEKAYFPFFAGNIFTELLSGNNPTIVGSPTTVSGGKSGAAYQGATDSYLTLPLAGLYSSEGISFTFWYKVNATPNRSGIIVINDDNDNSNDNRTKGLRLFREGTAASQTIKMNVGTGAGESWNDGGNLAVNGNWVHVAVTVSPTESKIYFDGVLQRTATFTSFDFSTSSMITIGSGAPSFTYWDHLSDLSQIDELRIYNKALDEAAVKATMQ
ncbi:MAG: LamG domain-containing protein [Chryseobacterium sp.]|nr:LamG domain-containing protein [Chryseobacterium sp.]